MQGSRQEREEIHFKGWWGAKTPSHARSNLAGFCILLTMVHADMPEHARLASSLWPFLNHPLPGLPSLHSTVPLPLPLTVQPPLPLASI